MIGAFLSLGINLHGASNHTLSVLLCRAVHLIVSFLILFIHLFSYTQVWVATCLRSLLYHVDQISPARASNQAPCIEYEPQPLDCQEVPTPSALYVTKHSSSFMPPCGSYLVSALLHISLRQLCKEDTGLPTFDRGRSQPSSPPGSLCVVLRPPFGVSAFLHNCITCMACISSQTFIHPYLQYYSWVLGTGLSQLGYKPPWARLIYILWFLVFNEHYVFVPVCLPQYTSPVLGM